MSHKPFLRRHMGTPSENFWHVLRVGGFGLFMIYFALPGVELKLRQFYEIHALPRPWMTAHVEILPGPEAAPRIRYGTEAVAILPDTTWRTRVATRDVWKVDGGSGTWTYSAGRREPALMSWYNFHGKDAKRPVEPYQVCVSYDMNTIHGARDVSPWTCSEFFDPSGN